MFIKVIPISSKPNFIVVAKFTKGITYDWEMYYHYHLNDLSTVNKNSDIGVWHCRYK